MSSTKGDPPPPGGSEKSDSSANVSADSEVQTSRAADSEVQTLTETETADAETDPPIIIQGGGAKGSSGSGE